MQFYEYITHYQVAKRSKHFKYSLTVFTDNYLRKLQSMAEALNSNLSTIDPFTPSLIVLECDWQLDRRPYYDIYPSIIPTLTKLKLDIDSSFFKLPLDRLLLRFPLNETNGLSFDFKGQKYRIRNILCENVMLPVKGNPSVRVPAISFWIDFNEKLSVESYSQAKSLAQRQGSRPYSNDLEEGSVSSLLYKHIVCEKGKTIEWSLLHCPPHDSSKVGVIIPDSMLADVTRLVCTICLLANDPEIVQPEVLDSDVVRYADSKDFKYVDKAHRRGKVGWSVGKDISVSPHYRNACLAALYWTGKGKTVPIIRFRAGCLVKRASVSVVPTGYLDDKKEDTDE